MSTTNNNSQAKNIHTDLGGSSVSFHNLSVYHINVWCVKIILYLKKSTESKSLVDGMDNENSSESTCKVSYILNNDCLIKIFEYLPLCDLCSVAEVCTMFQSCAVNVFASNFSNFDVNILMETDHNRDEYYEHIFDDSEEEDDENFPMESVEKVFRNFGSYIRSIHLDQEDFNESQGDQILKFMAQCCSNKNAELDKLALHDVTISSNLVESLQPLFARLKFLDISGGTYDYRNASLFSICSQLTELVLEEVNFGNCFKQKYENLERISLVDIRETYAGAFNDFARMNPQLKSLTITDTDVPSTELSSHFYSVISSLSELEELKLHTNKKILYNDVVKDLNHLAQLKNLKLFSFNCLWLPVGQLFNNFAEHNVPIEDLDLRNLSLASNIATGLSKLTQMKNIRFYDCETKPGQLPIAVEGMLHLEKLHLCNFEHVTVEDVKGVVQNARALKELKLFHQNDIVIGEKDFNEIGQLIKNRENNNMLNIDIVGSGCKLYVPAHIIEQYSLWLNVKVIAYKESFDIDIVEYYNDSDEDEYNSD